MTLEDISLCKTINLGSEQCQIKESYARQGISSRWPKKVECYMQDVDFKTSSGLNAKFSRPVFTWELYPSDYWHVTGWLFGGGHGARPCISLDLLLEKEGHGLHKSKLEVKYLYPQEKVYSKNEWITWGMEKNKENVDNSVPATLANSLITEQDKSDIINRVQQIIPAVCSWTDLQAKIDLSKQESLSAVSLNLKDPITTESRDVKLCLLVCYNGIKNDEVWVRPEMEVDVKGSAYVKKIFKRPISHLFFGTGRKSYELSDINYNSSSIRQPSDFSQSIEEFNRTLIAKGCDPFSDEERSKISQLYFVLVKRVKEYAKNKKAEYDGSMISLEKLKREYEEELKRPLPEICWGGSDAVAF